MPWLMLQMLLHLLLSTPPLPLLLPLLLLHARTPSLISLPTPFPLNLGSR
jgi:hypothetical protein